MKEGTATQPVGEEKKEELSHAQTALFHIYTQSPITKNNAQQIAESRGQTSGQKLHDRYKKMGKSLAERTSSRFAVTDIEKVMTLLSDPKQLKMAEDELKVAKSLRNK
ncbi:MAG: hypothetical protein EAZ14_11480 [Runella slithyformis]|nr:MAG: hypothetical protein EAZ14_11480 [Runella slithyformis]